MTDGNIFISYRRGRDNHTAGRLYERLTRSFDEDHLFFDIGSIPIGVDFVKVIEDRVASCSVLVVVLGQGWLAAMERLQNKDDFVRIEVAVALKRGNIPVMPALFDDARMPKREALPEDLRSLVRRNAITITHDQFAQIVDGRLVEELRKALGIGEAVEAIQPGGAPKSNADARFESFHGLIMQIEGGLFKGPNDRGGIQNWGITQETLAHWRGTSVGEEEVRNLSAGEATAIYKAEYFDYMRCGDMPDRVAMVVYDAGILHGPRLAICFLQTAFNNLGMTIDGKPLVVDGIIGQRTLSAAQQTDPSALSEEILQVREENLRKNEGFGHFGRAWLNRLETVREFVRGLPG